MLKFFLRNAHSNTLLSQFKLFSTTYKEIQDKVITSINNGDNVYVAGEPPENLDASVFTGLYRILVRDLKHSPVEKPIKLFKSIDALYKDYQNTTKESTTPRGSLIITASPDFGIQRYSTFRMMDSKDKLEISRIISSLEIYTTMINPVCLPF